jgi:hypothetical protein
MTDFDRYAPAMAIFFAGSALMAALFGAAIAIGGGSPVSPEVYGDTVYAVPALAWVAWQVAAGSIAALGCWQRVPRVAAIGAAGTTAAMLFFAVAALEAQQGTVLAAAAMGWAGPCSALAAVVCWHGGRHGG